MWVEEDLAERVESEQKFMLFYLTWLIMKTPNSNILVDISTDGKLTFKT